MKHLFLSGRLTAMLGLSCALGFAALPVHDARSASASGDARATCSGGQSGDKFRIRYRGRVDEAFLECLGRFIRVQYATLDLSADGGAVDLGIAAAHIIKLKQWDVRVIGVCADACANYLVPAARSVSIAEFSLVLLRDAPSEKSARAFEASVREGIRKAVTLPANEIEKIAHENIARNRLSLAAHKNFARVLGVGRYWYKASPAFARGQASVGGNPGAAIPADRAMIEACTSATVARDAWFPKSGADWARVTRRSSSRLLRRPTNGPYACD